MSISIKTEEYLLYAIALSGVVLQLIGWYWKYRSNQSEYIAHRLQRIAMLIDAYNDKKDKHDFEISHMIGEASSWVHRKAKQKSEIFKVTDKNITHILKAMKGNPKIYKFQKQIYDSSLKELIPNEILVQLKDFSDKEFAQVKSFIEAIENKIGKNQTENYIKIILKYANILESLKSIKNKGFREEDEYLRCLSDMIGDDSITKNKKNILKFSQMPYQEKRLFTVWLQRLLQKNILGEKKNVTIKSEAAEYDLPEHVVGSKKLFYMIQQNAYWNHHLFDYSFRYNLRIFFMIVSVIVFVLLLSFPFLLNDASYSFARIGLIFLSFILSYEILDKALVWRSSSKIMLAIDNQLNSANPNSEDIVMLIYSHYSVSKVVTPSIPDKIYQNKRDSLNLGWSERINKFKKAYENSEIEI